MMKCNKLSEDHAQWFSQIAKEIYKTAFEHGYKHGIEENRKQ